MYEEKKEVFVREGKRERRKRLNILNGRVADLYRGNIMFQTMDLIKNKLKSFNKAVEKKKKNEKGRKQTTDSSAVGDVGAFFTCY